MPSAPRTTLRLSMPQWQGGNDPAYHFGSQLLRFLAPSPKGPVETVAVPPPAVGVALEEDRGIVARGALLAQAKAARAAIERHRPERIVTLGGDCLVSLAPMAYLSARYGEAFGVLWVDAHPDVTPVALSPHGHTHVLGLLLGPEAGLGDPEFLREVDVPVAMPRVMFAGLDEWRANVDAVMQRLKLPRSSSADVAENSAAVLDWIAGSGIRHVAVHFDLDVLDPAHFRAVNFNRTDRGPDPYPGVPRGKMLTTQVVRLLRDVAAATDVVGLTIAEHMPWDTMAMRDMLAELPLLSE